MRAGLPELSSSIKEQIAEGDKVASRLEWTGTHDGAFLGVAATGKLVRLWGVVIDQSKEGRIEVTRIIIDTLALMMQLGVIPPPQAGSSFVVANLNEKLAGCCLDDGLETLQMLVSIPRGRSDKIV
jgi:hypothetical protein